MTAKRQNWNDQPDDTDEAYRNFKNAIYDAMIFAERYRRSLEHAKPENEAQTINVARRVGYATTAESIVRQLYTGIQ